MQPKPPPYPKFPEQDENGVDLSLIRAALALPPIERVRRNYQAVLAMCRMREKIKPIRTRMP